MRESREQKQETHEPQSSLGHCLLDSDAESLRLARSTRWRSMLLSSGIQAALLTAAVVLPLFATSDLVANRLLGPGDFYLPPVPPRAAPESRAPAPSGTRQSTGSHAIPITPITAPTGIPPSVTLFHDRDSAPPAVAGGWPDPGGSGVPGGLGDPSLLGGGGSALPPAPPPVEQEPPRRRRISVVHPAELLRKVEPIYPPLMKQIRKSGRVEFRAVIAKDGSIQELTLLSGDPGFVLAAQQAVLQWRYAPTILNGEPVEVETRITVIFTMNQ